MAHMSGVHDRRTLGLLVTEGGAAGGLELGAARAEPIEALQRILFYLGFGEELDWARLGADGRYEAHAQAAVAAFAAREGLPGDGARPPVALLAAMLDRYDAAVARDLAALSALVAAGPPDAALRVESRERGSVRALQRLLYVVGYGDEMKWEKFGDDGDYGVNTARSVAAFAAGVGVPGDGTSVSAAVARELIAAVVAGREKPAPLVTDALRVTNATIFVGGPGGDVKIASMVRFGSRRGWRALGELGVADVLERQPEAFAGQPPSILHVLHAVVRNEGCFDAVNAYDNAHLSFGIFQWTAGVAGERGELAAFLSALEGRDAPVARKYFGAFGLSAAGVTGGQTGPATGHLVLHGQTLNSAERKAPLRGAEWVYRFWKAGHDAAIQRAEIDHALARVQIFYRNPAKRIAGRVVADYVSSEVGVALLLDQHVNRPAHLLTTLASAVAETAGDLGDPGGWDDAAERHLLDRYLVHRHKTTMTDSVARGQRIRAHAGAGLSPARGSFAV